jgi:hypothetical protein
MISLLKGELFCSAAAPLQTFNKIMQSTEMKIMKLSTYFEKYNNDVVKRKSQNW